MCQLKRFVSPVHEKERAMHRIHLFTITYLFIKAIKIMKVICLVSENVLTIFVEMEVGLTSRPLNLSWASTSVVVIFTLIRDSLSIFVLIIKYPSPYPFLILSCLQFLNLLLL